MYPFTELRISDATYNLCGSSLIRGDIGPHVLKESLDSARPPSSLLRCVEIRRLPRDHGASRGERRHSTNHAGDSRGPDRSRRVPYGRSVTRPAIRDVEHFGIRLGSQITIRRDGTDKQPGGCRSMAWAASLLDFKKGTIATALIDEGGFRWLRAPAASTHSGPSLDVRLGQ